LSYPCLRPNLGNWHGTEDRAATNDAVNPAAIAREPFERFNARWRHAGVTRVKCASETMAYHAIATACRAFPRDAGGENRPGEAASLAWSLTSAGWLERPSCATRSMNSWVPKLLSSTVGSGLRIALENAVGQIKRPDDAGRSLGLNRLDTLRPHREWRVRKGGRGGVPPAVGALPHLPDGERPLLRGPRGRRPRPTHLSLRRG
jgi:hypothetical protein